MIHKYASVSKKTRIGKKVHIGAFSVIGPHVEIGNGTHIASNVLIEGHTKIGKNNRFFHGAAIGSIPQDLKFDGRERITHIGDNNTIREYVTINSGTDDEQLTFIGNNNLIMAYTHIAHDVSLKNHIILANNTNLAGHISIDSHAIISGLAAVHQFVKVGKYAFIGGGTLVTKDIIPYIKVSGNPARVIDLNTLGLQRHDFSDEDIKALKKSFRIIFRSNNNVSQALEKIKALSGESGKIYEIVKFIQKSDRGIMTKTSSSSLF